jgi:hypothetical protein
VVRTLTIKLTEREREALRELKLDDALVQQLNRSAELELDLEMAKTIVVEASVAVLDHHPDARVLDRVAERIYLAYEAANHEPLLAWRAAASAR